MKIFEPYNVFLAIASNIPQWLKTGFVGPGSHTINQAFEECLFVQFIISV